MFRKSLVNAIAAVGACLALTAPAQAVSIVGPFGPGANPIVMGDLTDKVGLFVNQHTGPNAVFADVFLFGVTVPSLAVGTILIPSPALPIQSPDLATIGAMFLLTLEGVPLAADVDGRDGFNVIGPLPGAGIYGLVVIGASGGGQGSYLGALGTTPIPEPSAALLFAAGLAGLGGWLRRRR